MTQTTVTHRCLVPGRGAHARPRVKVELVVPAFAGDGAALGGVRWVNLAPDGSCLLLLDPNPELNPAEAWYEVTDPDGTVWAIQVPVSPMPVALVDCLVEPVGRAGPVRVGATADELADVFTAAPRLAIDTDGVYYPAHPGGLAVDTDGTFYVAASNAVAQIAVDTDGVPYPIPVVNGVV